MKARRRNRRPTVGGRLVEFSANAALLVIVLAFAISIAARYGPGESAVQVPERAEGLSPEKAKGARSAPPAPGGRTRQDAASQTRLPRSERDATGNPGVPAASGESGTRETRAPGAAGSDEHARHVTVDVRNGSRRVGLANDMMHELRRAGFDVVECRNADHDEYERTEVRDLTGKPGAAEVAGWFQETYGVGHLQRQVIESPGSDVRVILGWDLADTLRRRERRAR